MEDDQPTREKFLFDALCAIRKVAAGPQTSDIALAEIHDIATKAVRGVHHLPKSAAGDLE